MLQSARTKTLIALFLTGIIWNCGPRFSSSPSQAHSFPVVMITSEDSTSPGELIIAEATDLEACTLGIGKIDVIARWSPENSQLRPLLKSLACSSLTIAETVILQERLGRCISIQQDPTGPLVHTNGEKDPRFFYRGGGTSFQVECTGNKINVRFGSYGNREGLEIEHLYEPRRAQGGIVHAVTIRCTSRDVVLEAFVGW